MADDTSGGRLSQAARTEYRWSLLRSRRAQSWFIGAVAFYYVYAVLIYPIVADLQDDPFASLATGDLVIEMELVEETGEHNISWDRVVGSSGYVLIRSDTTFEPAAYLATHAAGANLSALVDDVPRLDTANVTVLTGQNTTRWSEALADDSVWHVAVIAWTGEEANASLIGASGRIDTASLVAVGAYDSLIENPAMQAFIGGSLDFYSPAGFLTMYIFASMAPFILIYPVMMYSGLFVKELDRKSIDVLLATPLTRRELFLARNASIATWTVVGIVIWYVLCAAAALATIDGFDELAGRLLLATLSFGLLMLAFQALGAFASTVADDAGQASGMAFGVFIGMYVLRFISQAIDALDWLKWFSIFEYFDAQAIMVDGEFPVMRTLVLVAFAVLMFAVGLVRYERRDLAS